MSVPESSVLSPSPPEVNPAQSRPSGIDIRPHLSKLSESIGLLLFLLLIGGGLIWLYNPQVGSEWLSQVPVVSPLPTTSPAPTSEPETTSFLSDLQKEALTEARSQLSQSSEYRINQVLNKHNLTPAEKELALFLHLLYGGFTKQINDDTDRYYSGWYQYTVELPTEWKVFRGDAGRIGFLAPETEWSSGDYYHYDIVSDVFIHTTCEHEKSFKDFQTSMIAGRLEYYDYPNLTGPRDASVSAFPAKKYQYSIFFPKTSEFENRMAQITIEDHYFEANNAFYLINFRYDLKHKAEHNATLKTIMTSFQPGERACRYLYEQITSTDVDKLITELANTHDATGILVRLPQD